MIGKERHKILFPHHLWSPKLTIIPSPLKKKYSHWTLPTPSKYSSTPHAKVIVTTFVLHHPPPQFPIPVLHIYLLPPLPKASPSTPNLHNHLPKSGLLKIFKSLTLSPPHHFGVVIVSQQTKWNFLFPICRIPKKFLLQPFKLSYDNDRCIEQWHAISRNAG